MEETTTGASEATGAVIQGVAVDDQGQALPAAEEKETAATDTGTKTDNGADSGADKALPEDETAKLAKFAKGQGIEDIFSLSEREKGLLKSAYDSKVQFTQNRQKSSEMEKTMATMSDQSAEQVAEATGQDPEVLKRLQRMEVKDSIRDFWETHPDARQYESEMAKIATEAGLYGSPEAILKASYAMAVANNQDSVKSQGKREALESLAHKQQAAVPVGNAVNSGVSSETITPQNVNQLVGEHDQKWFEANYDAINRAMAG